MDYPPNQQTNYGGRKRGGGARNGERKNNTTSNNDNENNQYPNTNKRNNRGGRGGRGRGGNATHNRGGANNNTGYRQNNTNKDGNDPWHPQSIEAVGGTPTGYNTMNNNNGIRNMPPIQCRRILTGLAPQTETVDMESTYHERISTYGHNTNGRLSEYGTTHVNHFQPAPASPLKRHTVKLLNKASPNAENLHENGAAVQRRDTNFFGIPTGVGPVSGHPELNSYRAHRLEQSVGWDPADDVHLESTSTPRDTRLAANYDSIRGPHFNYVRTTTMAGGKFQAGNVVSLDNESLYATHNQVPPMNIQSTQTPSHAYLNGPAQATSNTIPASNDQLEGLLKQVAQWWGNQNSNTQGHGGGVPDVERLINLLNTNNIYPHEVPNMYTLEMAQSQQHQREQERAHKAKRQEEEELRELRNKEEKNAYLSMRLKVKNRNVEKGEGQGVLPPFDEAQRFNKVLDMPQKMSQKDDIEELQMKPTFGIANRPNRPAMPTLSTRPPSRPPHGVPIGRFGTSRAHFKTDATLCAPEKVPSILLNPIDINVSSSSASSRESTPSAPSSTLLISAPSSSSMTSSFCDPEEDRSIFESAEEELVDASDDLVDRCGPVFDVPEVIISSRAHDYNTTRGNVASNVCPPLTSVSMPVIKVTHTAVGSEVSTIRTPQHQPNTSAEESPKDKKAKLEEGLAEFELLVASLSRPSPTASTRDAIIHVNHVPKVSVHEQVPGNPSNVPPGETPLYKTSVMDAYTNALPVSGPNPDDLMEGSNRFDFVNDRLEIESSNSTHPLCRMEGEGESEEGNTAIWNHVAAPKRVVQDISLDREAQNKYIYYRIRSLFNGRSFEYPHQTAIWVEGSYQNPYDNNEQEDWITSIHRENLSERFINDIESDECDNVCEISNDHDHDDEINNDRDDNTPSMSQYERHTGAQKYQRGYYGGYYGGANTVTYYNGKPINSYRKGHYAADPIYHNTRPGRDDPPTPSGGGYGETHHNAPYRRNNNTNNRGGYNTYNANNNGYGPSNNNRFGGAGPRRRGGYRGADGRQQADKHTPPDVYA